MQWGVVDVPVDQTFHAYNLNVGLASVDRILNVSATIRNPYGLDGSIGCYARPASSSSIEIMCDSDTYGTSNTNPVYWLVISY